MSSHHHHQHHATNGGGAHPAHIPYWKRAHADWRFWVGVMLMFVAMIIYVMSGDLAWRPDLQPRQPVPIEVGK
jgi:hypothetical protein